MANSINSYLSVSWIYQTKPESKKYNLFLAEDDRPLIVQFAAKESIHFSGKQLFFYIKSHSNAFNDVACVIKNESSSTSNKKLRLYVLMFLFPYVFTSLRSQKVIFMFNLNLRSYEQLFVLVFYDFCLSYIHLLVAFFILIF